MFQDRNRRGKVIGPTQHRVYLRHQNALIERLGDKIVGAHVHSHDNIHIMRRRGNENNRYLGNFPDFTAPVIPVKKGQRDVEKRQMRIELRKIRHNAAKILYTFYL